jgi:VWFA-related protein
MKHIVHALLLGTVALSGSVPRLAAQAPAKSDSSREGDVTAILVDVVVRDRAGQPVADLKPGDFQIVEAGVSQELGSFTPIFRDVPAVTPASTVLTSRPAVPTAPVTTAAPDVPGAAAATAAANTPGEVLALVFDRLGQEARATAHKAALDYIGSEAPDGRVVAVYGIDLGLVPYQGFTRDMTRVRTAIAEFSTRAISQFGATGEQRRALQEQALRSGIAAAAATQAAGGGPGATGGSQNIGGAVVDQMFMEMQQHSLQAFDALERDQQGYSTANALMAVVSSMRTLPGRKAVVFFSEGLSIPTNAQERFLSVIAAANRANVSIYTVDTAGLRVESTLKETREEIVAAGNRTLQRNPTRDPTGEPMTAALERNENNLRLNPHSGLGMLADQTGGLLVSNTNDFRRGLARVDSDMRNYYMLTYVPRNLDFDGRFREIAVKVSRPGVTVQHRKGYFAVRAPAGVPVLSYEAPALAILDKTPVPSAFPVRVGALSFPEASRPGLTPIIVELPTSVLMFQAAPDDPATHVTDAAVVVRIRNDAGEIVDKMSQRYELRVAPDQLERAKGGEIIFYREPELPPGLYTVETVVLDALAKKASVRFTTVEKPAPNLDALRVSTLVLIRRAEKVPEADRIADNPLYLGDTLLYPNLGTELRRGTDHEIGFYFTAYVPNGSDAPNAVLELLQNAKVVAQVPVQLPAADAQGRIQQVSRIPIDQLTAGTYELRIVVRANGTPVSRTAQFRIRE